MLYYIILIASGLSALICVALILCRTEKPVLTGALSAGLGAAALLGVNAAAPLTATVLEVNLVTSAVSVILGLPGVIAMLLMRLALR